MSLLHQDSHVIQFHGAMKPSIIKHRPRANLGLCLMLAGAIFLTLLALVCKASLYV